MKIRRMLFVSVLSVLLLGVTSNVQAGFLSFAWSQFKEDARLIWEGAKSGIYTVTALAKGDIPGAIIQTSAMFGYAVAETTGEANPLSEMRGHETETALVVFSSKIYSDFTGNVKTHENVKNIVAIYELGKTVYNVKGYTKIDISSANKKMSAVLNNGKKLDKATKQAFEQYGTLANAIIDEIENLRDYNNTQDQQKEDTKGEGQKEDTKGEGQKGDTKGEGQKGDTKGEGQRLSINTKQEGGNYILTNEYNHTQICIPSDVLDSIINQCVADFNKDDGNFEGVLPVEAPGGRRNNGGKPVVTPVKPIEIYRE